MEILMDADANEKTDEAVFIDSKANGMSMITGFITNIKLL
jgi:hypothetical protein